MGKGFPYLVVGRDVPATMRRKAHVVATGHPKADRLALRKALGALDERPVLLYGTFHPARGRLRARPRRAHPEIRGESVIFTPDAPYPTPALELCGSRTVIPLTGWPSQLNMGTNVITHTYADAPKMLKRGDWIALTTNIGWSSRPGENYAGETLQVESVTATQIVTLTPFRYTYPLSAGGFTAQLYRYNLLKRPVLEGITMIGPGGEGHPQMSSTNRERGMVMTYCVDGEIIGCTMNGPFMREGFGIYETIRTVLRNWVAIDVNDQAGNSGSYEGYGARVMSGEGVILADGHGRGCRHLTEANGGQGSYGLPSGQKRPIAYGTVMRDIHVIKSWASGVTDHPGASNTTFERITTNGCSGGIYIRGRYAKVRDLNCIGGHHQTGPYSGGQGNDHAVYIGEQARNPDNSTNNTTRDGWCGTDISVTGVTHSMEGNGGSLGSTSHTIYSVHPLVRFTFDFGNGRCRPTGDGLRATGAFNRDVKVRGVVDASSAFGAHGRAVYMVPNPTSPATTFPPTTDVDIDVGIIKPRNKAVEVAGVDRVVIKARDLTP